MDFQKNAKTSLTFVLVAVTLLSVSLIQNYAFAQGQGMEITANAAEGSTSISISGHTATTNNAITLQVMAPNGNRVSVAQVMPDANGDFMTEFQIDGAVIPEFGAISAMVLAVAFISIIVVTAKTRLRILPKH